jgi:hypothetical protein
MDEEFDASQYEMDLLTGGCSDASLVRANAHMADLAG